MIRVPIRIESVANKREHWAAKAKRTKRQRAALYWALLADVKVRPALPLVVTLTRIAPRVLDDDNLSSGFKACRDGIADWLGVDDGDLRIQWKYAQAKGEPKEYAATVLFAATAIARADFEAAA